jgi:hypothetical protein
MDVCETLFHMLKKNEKNGGFHETSPENVGRRLCKSTKTGCVFLGRKRMVPMEKKR